jgi:hypothetical protein
MAVLFERGLAWSSETSGLTNRIPSMQRAGGSPATNDVPTMAAIGITSALLMLVVHEGLGHSLLTVLLGARFVELTSIDSSYGGLTSPVVARIIAAAGITANIVAGGLALLALRWIPSAPATLRYFIWIFAHATLFMGSSYLAGFAFLPFGDVHAAIDGLPFQLAWQVACVVAGAALYRVAYLDARRTFATWTDGNSQTDQRLATVPYIAMGLVVTAASALNPHSHLLGAVWGAVATFGACYGLVAAAVAARPSSGAGTVLSVPRNPAWIVAGLAAALTFFAVLGPGIPR